MWLGHGGQVPKRVHLPAEKEDRGAHFCRTGATNKQKNVLLNRVFEQWDKAA
jgi:hypothetical protein